MHNAAEKLLHALRIINDARRKRFAFSPSDNKVYSQQCFLALIESKTHDEQKFSIKNISAEYFNGSREFTECLERLQVM